MQKSFQADNVINASLGHQRRTPVKQVLSDNTDDTLQDLVLFLFNKKELIREYHVENDNCQHFPARVYDHFAIAKSTYAVDAK